MKAEHHAQRPDAPRRDRREVVSQPPGEGGAQVTPSRADAGGLGGDPAAPRANADGLGGTAAAGRTARRPWLVAVIALLALLDTGGYVSFNLGVGHAATAIVAAASAPYALVPIAMGVSVLRERPTRAQWLGVTCVLVGVVVMGVVT